jgi:transposase
LLLSRPIRAGVTTAPSPPAASAEDDEAVLNALADGLIAAAKCARGALN